MKQIFYDFGHTVSAELCEAVSMVRSGNEMIKNKADCIEIEVHYDKNPDVTLAISKQSALNLAKQITDIFAVN